MKKLKINAAAVVAIIVFLSGILTIYSAFFRIHPGRMLILEELLPLGIRHISRTGAILAGFGLIFLAWGLKNRKYRAWWISCLVLSFAVFFNVTKNFDLDAVVVLLIPLILLIIFKAEFSVRSATLRLYKRMALAAAVLLLLLAYSTIGFFLLPRQFTRQVTWPNVYKDYEYSIFGIGQNTLISTTRRARWFEDSISTVGAAALISVLVVLFAPEIFKDQPTEESLEKAKDIVGNFGAHPVSYLSLMDDKRYFISESGNCLIAYKIKTGIVTVLGDPMGPKEELENFSKEFFEKIQKHGMTTVFYQTTDGSKDIYKKMGLKMIRVGEDAIIDLSKFDLNTPEMKNVRNSYNHIKKKNIRYIWHNMEELPWKELVKIQKLYESWLKTRKSAPMTFSMDFFPFPPDKEGLILTAQDENNNLVGCFSFFPFNQGRGRTLDLMLRSQNAPSGLVDTCLTEALLKFKSEGLTQASLGLATASISENYISDSPMAQKALDFIYKNINSFYNYQSLAAFKIKFNPSWQPRYLAYQSDADLPKIALALAQVHTGEEIKYDK